MRVLTDHLVACLPETRQVAVSVLDEAGPGGASHAFEISWRDEADKRHLPDAAHQCYLSFQCGAVDEVGKNGITHEALLAIIIDRLRSFQAGEFPCDENELALSHCSAALRLLHRRTRNRVARKVEGKLEP